MQVAVADVQRSVGSGCDFAVVRDHDHRGICAMHEIEHEIQDESPCLLVKCTRWLVSEYETGPDHESARNRNPLTFTATDLDGAPSREMADSQLV